MGYHSEVGFSLTKKDFETMVSNAKTQTSEELDVLDLLRSADSIIQTDHIITIHYDWIKWPSTCSEVQFIMEFLRNEATGGYGFVRVGEENCDDETEYEDGLDGTCFYDYLNIVRSMDIPEGEELALSAFL